MNLIKDFNELKTGDYISVYYRNSLFLVGIIHIISMYKSQSHKVEVIHISQRFDKKLYSGPYTLGSMNANPDRCIFLLKEDEIIEHILKEVI